MLDGYLPMTVLTYLLFGICFLIGIRDEDYVSNLKRIMVKFSIIWGIAGLVGLLAEIIGFVLH